MCSLSLLNAYSHQANEQVSVDDYDDEISDRKDTQDCFFINYYMFIKYIEYMNVLKNSN